MDTIVLIAASVVIGGSLILGAAKLRRWATCGFRFHTRSALAAFAVLAIVLWLWLEWGWPVLRHRFAVQHIRHAGGWLYFNDQDAIENGFEAWQDAQANAWLSVADVELGSDAEVDAAAESLNSLTKLDGLTLESRVTDASLFRLSKLRPPLRLKSLQFIQSNVTDLAPLAQFGGIEQLFLNSPTLGDDGLRGLPDIRGLKKLFLLEEQPNANPQRFSERAYEAIRKMPQLETLWIFNHRIANGSAEHLLKMAGLRELRLSRCIIEDEAMDRLRAGWPGCQVSLENCHVP